MNLTQYVAYVATLAVVIGSGGALCLIVCSHVTKQANRVISEIRKKKP